MQIFRYLVSVENEVIPTYENEVIRGISAVEYVRNENIL